jgi:hypothetical protein
MLKFSTWNISFSVAFVILLVLSAEKISAQMPTHMWVGAGTGFLISYDNRYSAKTQWGIQAQTGIISGLNSALSISAAVEFAHIYPSNLDEGFLYRGFSSLSPSIHLHAHAGQPLSMKPDLRRIIMSGGIEGSFAQYTMTNDYFFFLSASMTTTILFATSVSERWLLKLSLPAKIYFRNGFAFSMSIGLSCSFLFDITMKNIENQ